MKRARWRGCRKRRDNTYLSFTVKRHEISSFKCQIKFKRSILIGIKSNIKFTDKDLGISISCDGVCLTITKIKKNVVYFYISNETLNLV